MKKFTIFFLVLLMIGGLSGCLFDEEPEAAPEEVMETAFSNLGSAISFSAEGYTNFNTNSLETAIDADVKFELIHDLSLFSVNIDAEYSDSDGQEQNFSGELRWDGENAYLLVGEISDFGGYASIMMIEPFIAQWWKFIVPEELLGEGGWIPAQSDVFEYFEEIEYVGSSWHDYYYEASVNKDALRELALESYELAGEEVLQEDLAELELALDAIEMSVEFWVNKENMVLTNFKSIMTMSVLGEGSAAFEFGISFDDIGESVEIGFPEDAMEFDLGALFEGEVSE